MVGVMSIKDRGSEWSKKKWGSPGFLSHRRLLREVRALGQGISFCVAVCQHVIVTEGKAPKLNISGFSVEETASVKCSHAEESASYLTESWEQTCLFLNTPPHKPMYLEHLL